MSDREEIQQASTSGDFNFQDTHIEKLIVYQSAGAEESNREEAFSQRIKSLCNGLQSSLKEYAESNSNTNPESGMEIISNIHITTVPLHIRQDEPKEWLDKLGHYHKRSDIINRIEEVTEGNPCYTDPQELLRDAAKMAEKNSEKNYQNDVAKKKYQVRHGNIVGIVGQAGVGKTTYMKQLVQKFLSPETESSTDDEFYIFYLAFRNVNYDFETTLLKFLTISCGLTDWNTTTEEDLAITKYLAKNEKVMILMDGYDEADIPESSLKCPRIKFDQKAKAQVFINNLIGGRILPLAKKFISSRPRQLYEMDKDCIPKFVVKILGLDEVGQQRIISNVCGENTDKVQRMFERHPDITTFCHAPLNCILTAYCFNQTTDESQIENQHYTITTTLVTVIGCFAKNESEKSASRKLKAKEMSNIAWKMFKAKEFYVDAKTLNDAGIKEKNVTAFLTTSKGQKRKFSIISKLQKRKIYFSHLLLEEFFVALNLRFFMDIEEFQKIFDHIDENQYEVVSKFLYGMFNQVTVEYLNECFPDCFHYDHFGKPKFALLKNLIISKLKSIQNVNSYKKFVTKSYKKRINQNGDSNKKKFVIILQVSSWLYEMKDDEFTQQISFPATIVISADSILPGEIPPLLYMFQFTKETTEIKIGRSKFKKNSLDLLLDGFSQISSKIKLTEVDLSHTNINEEKMKKLSGCFSNVTNLNLDSCKLSSESAKILSNAISHNKTKLQSLKLGNNKIGDEGAGYISTSVQYIEILVLENCGITAAGAEKLANGLQKSQSKLQNLKLDYNKIGDEGAGYISTSVQYIENLNLRNCGITAAGAKKLANGLQKSQSKLQELILGDNKIGDEGAGYISTSVQYIENLYLRNCGITAAGAEKLANGLQKSQSKMNELDIHKNKIGDQRFTAVSKVVHKVNKLWIGDSDDQNLTMKGISNLCEEIQNLTTPMEYLYIWCSDALNEEAKPMLEKLKVSGKLKGYYISRF